MADKDKMLEVIAALKEQVRHVSSLRCGYGTSDAIQAHDALVEMLTQAAKESSRKELADMEIVARNYRTRFLGSDKELEELRKSHRSLVTHHLKVDEELEAAKQRIAELEGALVKESQANGGIEALEKKLAEQQALLRAHFDIWPEEYFDEAAQEELTKLLAAAREQGFEEGKREFEIKRDVAVSSLQLSQENHRAATKALSIACAKIKAAEQRGFESAQSAGFTDDDLAAARQQGFEEGKQRISELESQLSRRELYFANELAAERKAGRDEFPESDLDQAQRIR